MLVQKHTVPGTFFNTKMDGFIPIQKRSEIFPVDIQYVRYINASSTSSGYLSPVP